MAEKNDLCSLELCVVESISFEISKPIDTIYDYDDNLVYMTKNHKI